MRIRGRHGGHAGSEAGFTLVEVLTTMLMMGVGLTAAFAFFSSGLTRTTGTESRVETMATLQGLGERMARDVRQSASVCTPAPSPSADVLYLSGPPDPASPSTASDCVASRMITWDCASASGACSRKQGTGAAETIADGLAGSPAIFTYSANDYISIELASLPMDHERPIVIEQGAALRNYCDGGCS